jgi:hypothetical protein
MGGLKTPIEIILKSVNPFEIKAKTKALTDLAQLDVDVLTKLAELAKSPNAVEQLKTNFPMIKGFLS